MSFQGLSCCLHIFCSVTVSRVREKQVLSSKLCVNMAVNDIESVKTIKGLLHTPTKDACSKLAFSLTPGLQKNPN